MVLRTLAKSAVPTASRYWQRSLRKKVNIPKNLNTSVISQIGNSLLFSNSLNFQSPDGPSCSNVYSACFSSSSSGDSSAQAEQTEQGAEASETTSGQTEESDEKTEDASSKTAEPTSEEIIDDLKVQLKDAKDKMMMAYANEENALRIAKQDVAKARQFAVQSFAKSLLEVADNLSRASSVVSAEAVEEHEGHDLLKQLVEGVQLTENGLLKVFKSQGIVPFGKSGEEFDANIHEALYMYEDPTATPGTLGQIVSTGYMIKERVLRPCKVGVVKESEAETASSSTV
jgi:molecular chaperone GrpE